MICLSERKAVGPFYKDCLVPEEFENEKILTGSYLFLFSYY